MSRGKSGPRAGPRPGSGQRPGQHGEKGQAAGRPSKNLNEKEGVPALRDPWRRKLEKSRRDAHVCIRVRWPIPRPGLQVPGCPAARLGFLAARPAGFEQVAAVWHAPLLSGVNKGETLPSTVIGVQVGGESPRAFCSCLCRAECPAAWHSCAWRGSCSALRDPGPAPRRVPRGPAAVRAPPRRPWGPTAPARGPQRELGLGGRRQCG